MQRVWLEYRDRGVIFLGAFVHGTSEQIRTFAETYHLTFPVGEENGTVADTLGATTLPETVFVSPAGRIVGRHKGTIGYDALVAGVESIVEPAK